MIFFKDRRSHFYIVSDLIILKAGLSWCLVVKTKLVAAFSLIVSDLNFIFVTKL
jgi:hypothetical protein